KVRLSAEERALVENWATTLKASNRSKVPDASVFAGTAIKVQWHEDGGARAGEWNQTWDGRGEITGVLTNVPPEAALNLKLSILGEDSQPVFEKTFFRVDRARKNVVLESMVREADIKKHFTDAEAPKPGASGVIRATHVQRDSISVSWE